MNKKNFDAWIEELRTTDKKQGKNVLKNTLPNDSVEYCCLGIGCELADIHEERPESWGPSSFAGWDTLAPPEFLYWLGVWDGLNHDETDLYPDWGDVIGNLQDGDRNYLRYLSAASMNDGGDFTFAQIADVFAYFGIREL